MRLTLNIGSGDRVYDEFPEKSNNKCINFDFRKNLNKVDVVGDVRHLPFSDDAFDYVLASDIIEHFSIKMTKTILFEWRRVLKRGCVMEIRTPNLKYIAEHYMKYKDTKFASHHIFGGQDYTGNFHYVIFDRPWLSKLCRQTGLGEVEYKEDVTNFILKVRKL